MRHMLALFLALSLPAQAEPLRIALGSCNHQEDDQSVWNQLAAVEPDLFLFLGDNVYGDSYRDERPGLAGLRYAYALQAKSRPYRSFAAKTPIYPIWDDHDYGLNDAGEELPFKAEAKAELLKFFDFPQESDVAGRAGVYYSFMRAHEGLQVQVIMLDTRWNRTPLTRIARRIEARRGAYIDDPSPDGDYLGAEQWAWLGAELQKPADIRLIASSIQVLADGHHYERWGNLVPARERLFALLHDSGAKGIVLLSGDRHLGGIYRRDDILDYPLYEFTASSLNRGGWALADEAGPHQIVPTYGPENFGTIDIDGDAETLRLALHRAEDGKVTRAVTIPIPGR